MDTNETLSRDDIIAFFNRNHAVAMVRAPIGLNLGGRAPNEIALAVMAEIVATRSGSPLAIRR